MRPTLALTAQLPSGLRPSFQSSSIFRILFLWGSALPATKILYEKFSCVWLGWVFHLSGSSRRPHPLTGRMQLRDGPAPNVVLLWLDLHPLHPSTPPSPHPSITSTPPSPPPPPSLHPGQEGSWSSIPGRLHVRRRVRAAAFRLKSPRKTEGKKEKNKKTQLRLGC